MSPANDNSATGSDLALPRCRLLPLPAIGGAGVDLVAGGVHHVARITLRAAPASSGKLQPVTGSNLRAAPAELNAVAGALAAMLAELPVRGGILDRLS